MTDASPPIEKGSLIADRYRLERHLGEGGMGTVWAALHVVTRRSVAMKFLRAAVAHKPDVRQRFIREAQAASSLRHPNVVEVLDVFDLPDGSPVIVMELLNGETLGEKLVRDERLSMEETAAVLLPVVAGVGAAHAHGIIHRDLKPENVFLARANDATVVKVLDFGIAKLFGEQHRHQGQSMLVTESGSLLGTPCYMAPEQMGNADVDFRADIWSLGVILYECLSGTRPIEGQNMAEVVTRLMTDAIVPLDRLAPQLPHDVTALVQQMLTRDPKRRLQDLGELTRVLGRFAPFQMPSFGPPRSVAIIDEPTPDSIAQKTTLPPIRTGAGVRRTTMLSAPAVGVSNPGSPSPMSASGNRTRIGVYIVGAVVCLLLALVWLGQRNRDPLDTTSPSAVAAAKEPAVGAAAPVVANTAPPAPASSPSTAPIIAPPVPSGNATHTNEHISSAKARPVSAPVHAAPRPGAAAPNEDTLFSGRK